MEKVQLLSLHEQFIQYFTLNWDDDAVHTTRDLADHFKIEFRLARYHLMKLVDDGLLCQVKYEGNTWYLKRKYYDEFKELRPYIKLT
jgi:predicted HTH transcriptional regulator